mgnify:CR=1 FL=1
MSSRTPFLAAFSVRSFRFQWPADLLSSWALEMEVLILNWYVLVETGSVTALALFAGLQYLGAAFSQAYKLDTPAPDNLSQSQWNRALRDQGERLRAASLTLGSGRETIAAEQLSALSAFIEKHFSDFAA